MDNKTRVQYLLLRKALQQKYNVPTDVMNQLVWFIPPECKGEVLKWDKWKEDPHEYAIVWYEWTARTTKPHRLFRAGDYHYYCEYCRVKLKLDGWDEYCPKCGLEPVLVNNVFN